MPRIGFVDHRLDNFHANKLLSILRGELAGRGWEIGGACATDEAPGRAWAEANAVAYCHDPAALNERVDAFMVLAPSDPQLHPALCQKVLRFGKPTYVDKTFAADLAAAEAIFRQADRCGAAMQSSSALRYTNVQAYAREHGVEHMVTWGGGRSAAEYAIHPVELVVSCMGPGAQRLMRRGGDERMQLLIDFDGGRTAVVNVYCNSDTPYAAAVTTAKRTQHMAVDAARMFVDLMADVLDLFESREPRIDRAQTLMVRRILDAGFSDEAVGRFVDLSS